METVKAFGFFLLKVLLCIIIINGVLSLLGGGIVSNLVTNPVGTIKRWFTKSTASNAASPAA